MKPPPDSPDSATVSSAPKFGNLLLACVALTWLLCAVSIVARYKIEARNRSVSICAEYETVESLAASQGIGVERALSSLRDQGLRSIVLTEETAGDLIGEGRLAVRYAPGARIASPIVSGAPDDIARLIRGNRIRYGAFSAPVQVGTDGWQFPNLTPGMLRALPLGIDPDAARRIAAARLLIVARLGNPIGISPQGVEDTVAWAAQSGAQVFCPVGEQVLGRRDGAFALARALAAHHMLYASPEFAKIGGDQQMLQIAPELVVRLHSAQTAELDKLPPSEAIDRYARAARERNMRLLLLRPIDYAATQPLFQFGQFVKAVARAVVRQGAEIGEPHAFGAPKLPKALFALIALSFAPCAWLVGGRFGSRWALALLGAAVLVAIAAYSPHMRQYAALFGAILFPCAAFLHLETSRWRSAFGAYLLTTLVSLTGGLGVAALLNALPYYVVAYEFPGVKLAVFAPIALAGIYFFVRLGRGKRALASPVTWGSALLTLVLLAAIALMLARTGNDNPATVSSWELKLRDLLDVLLYVRPRTKAFLIGFPMLFLGVSMLLRYRRLERLAEPETLARFGGWTALVLTCGMIAQTDVVNTMCHIHTQVALSLERIGVEIVVGLILGLILAFVVERLGLLPKAEPD